MPDPGLVQPVYLGGEGWQQRVGEGELLPMAHLGGTLEFGADIAAARELQPLARLAPGNRFGRLETEPAHPLGVLVAAARLAAPQGGVDERVDCVWTAELLDYDRAVAHPQAVEGVAAPVDDLGPVGHAVPHYGLDLRPETFVVGIYLYYMS